MSTRKVNQVFVGQQTSDGAGVKLTRILDPRTASLLDPFLLFDEFRSDSANDYIAGFPPHPHRGFETVTYMFAGRMKHRDHMGNEGLLKQQGAQWMTAGRGIIHSEMPEQEEGLMHGYQLWLNLPAKEKMQTASYQDIEPEQIPEYDFADGVQVRMIAGQLVKADGTSLSGVVQRESTQVVYAHFTLEKGAKLSVVTPAGHTALSVVVRGQITVPTESGNRNVSAREAVLFTQGEELYVENQDTDSVEILLLLGKPLGEPVSHYGPFVMNTREEIDQAVKDYSAGTLTA